MDIKEGEGRGPLKTVWLTGGWSTTGAQLPLEGPHPESLKAAVTSPGRLAGPESRIETELLRPPNSAEL